MQKRTRDIDPDGLREDDGVYPVAPKGAPTDSPKATGEFPHTGTIEKLLARLSGTPDNIMVNVLAGDLRALALLPAPSSGLQDVSSNYVADNEKYPTTVLFANGRRVSIAHVPGDRAFLTVDRDDAEAERLMPRQSRLSVGRKALNEAKVAFRPQEQPRKATGHIGKITMALSLFASAIKAGEDWTPICETALRDAFDAVGRLSVSPAAAQGWQTVPKVATEAMLHAATMIAPTWDDAASRAKYAAMLAAAPPSPQEQEKGEQT